VLVRFILCHVAEISYLQYNGVGMSVEEQDACPVLSSAGP
jgi:hypothetical protein